MSTLGQSFSYPIALMSILSPHELFANSSMLKISFRGDVYEISYYNSSITTSDFPFYKNEVEFESLMFSIENKYMNKSIEPLTAIKLLFRLMTHDRFRVSPTPFAHDGPWFTFTPHWRFVLQRIERVLQYEHVYVDRYKNLIDRILVDVKFASIDPAGRRKIHNSKPTSDNFEKLGSKFKDLEEIMANDPIFNNSKSIQLSDSIIVLK